MRNVSKEGVSHFFKALKRFCHVVKRLGKLGNLDIMLINVYSSGEIALGKALGSGCHFTKRLYYTLGDNICRNNGRDHYPNRAIDNNTASDGNKVMLLIGVGKRHYVADRFTVNINRLCIHHVLIL